MQYNNTKVIPVVIGNYFNAYGVIRAFANHNIKSILVTNEPNCFVAKSKYLQNVVVSKMDNEESFIKDIIEYGEKIHPDRGMLFPTHDEQLLYIAKYKSELEKYYEIPFSDYDILSNIMDKKKFTKECQKMNIPTIREILVSSVEDAKQVINTFRFPVIVKLDIWNRDVIKAIDGKINIYYDIEKFENDMHHFFEILPEENLLVQEYIEDSDRLMPNINSISDKNGELCCIFVSEKLRQYPPQTGTSTATISADPEDERYSSIIEYAKKIVKHFGFYGLFGIEFKFDKNEQCYKVIEMNCRSEFPNYLQVIVGQNMPYYLYNYHLGRESSIPYFPRENNALCYVPFLDKYYSTKVNLYKNCKFMLSKEEWEKSIFSPYTLHGISIKDIRPYVKAYIQSIKKGMVELYRIKNRIPNTMSMKEYFWNKVKEIKR